MTVWFTSDSHFGHDRIISLSNRPFKDVNHMNEMLVKNWNEVVGLDDHVFHLGDVALGSFASSIAYVGRLNGFKHLIVGNHDRLFIDPDVKNIEKANRYADRFRQSYYDVFTSVNEGDGLHAAERLFIPEIKVNLTKGMSAATDVWRLSHFPYTGDSHDKPRYDAIRPVDDGKTLLHGHTHSNDKVSYSANGTLQIHVGVDSNDYRPVSEEEISNLIKVNL